MKSPRSFASDNNASIHPAVLAAVTKANEGQYISYGDDPFTERAVAKFKEHFGDKSEPFFVFNGTGANVLGLSALTKSYQAILCSDLAHAQIDECGAPEKYLGSKLVLVRSKKGKIGVEDLESRLVGKGDQHHVQPKVVSLTQSTELGTVYSLEELRSISKFCKKHGLYFHMDGARLSNAAAFLNVSLKEITKDVGVDVVSFGGTKNGLLLGEAVVFLSEGELAQEFKYIRKQGMQLASKMRYISAQFEALLTNDLWKKNASHANLMTQELLKNLKRFSNVVIAHEPQANAIFACLPRLTIEKLQREFYFYVVDESQNMCRFMTSFETTLEDIGFFTDALKRALKC